MIKFNSNFKLIFLLKFIIILLFFSFKSYAGNVDTEKNEVVLGSSNAPVKIKIFSSFTCPHCADFHFNVIPKLKKEYADNNIIQLIFIDFPLDQAAFNASKLLHCLDKKKQISFMDSVYKNQNKWTSGSAIEDINNNLKKIVKNLGITPEYFDKCLINEEISDKILEGRINAHKKYSINSTPTVVINEKKLEGSANFENIKKKIEKLI